MSARFSRECPAFPRPLWRVSRFSIKEITDSLCHPLRAFSEAMIFIVMLSMRMAASLMRCPLHAAYNERTPFAPERVHIPVQKASDCFFDFFVLIAQRRTHPARSAESLRRSALLQRCTARRASSSSPARRSARTASASCIPHSPNRRR